jgi:WD40 repeat protein
LIDLKTKVMTTLPGTNPRAVAFAPDGQTLAGAGKSGTVHVWDLRGGKPKEVWSKKGHDHDGHYADAVSFAPDGKTLVSTEGGFNAQRPLLAICWNTADGEVVKKWDLPERCASGIFAASRPYLILGCHDHKVYILRLEDGDESQPSKDPGNVVFKAPWAGAYPLVVSPDNHLVFSSEGWHASIWELKTGKVVHRLSNSGPITCAVFSPNGRQLLYGTAEMAQDANRVWRPVGGRIKLWDLDKRTEVSRFEQKSQVRAVAISPDGLRALSGGGDISIKKAKGVYTDCVLRLWDLKAGEKLGQFPEQDLEIRMVMFSEDGRLAFSRTRNQLRCYNVETRQEVYTFPHARDLLVVSKDGNHVLGTWANNVIRLWDRDGKLIHSFGGLKASPQCLAISSDNRRALVGCADYLKRGGKFVTKERNQLIPVHCLVYLLDLEKHRELACFEGHTNFMTSVAFSADGQFGLSCSTRGYMRLWDLKTLKPAVQEPAGPGVVKGKDEEKFRTANGPVRCLAVSPDGRLALTGSGNIAQLWDIAKGEEKWRLDQRGWISCAAFSPNGDRVLTGSGSMVGIKGKLTPQGCTLRLWSVKTGKEIRHFDFKTPVQSAAFSPDGHRALSGSGMVLTQNRKLVHVDCQMRLWNLDTGTVLKRFTEPDGGVRHVAFSADGRHAFCRGHLQLRCWDINSGKEIYVFPHRGYDMEFFGDESHVLGRSRRAVCLWKRDGTLVHSFAGFQTRPRCLAVSADGRRALVGCGAAVMGQQVMKDCTVHLLALDQGIELARFEGHTQIIERVAFTPDGRWALSGDFQGRIRVWDLEKFQPAGAKTVKAKAPDQEADPKPAADPVDITKRNNVIFSKHKGAVSPLVVSPDKRRVFSGSGFTAYLWDLRTGRELRPFQNFGGINCAAFSSKGRLLLYGTEDLADAQRGQREGGSVRLWDTAKRKQVWLRHTAGPIDAVALSPDGNRVLAASREMIIKNNQKESGPSFLRLWDRKSAKQPKPFAHQDAHSIITRVGFSPDGSEAWTVAANQLSFWDLQTKQLASVFPHRSQSFVISRDGTCILGMDRQGKDIRLWDKDGKELHGIALPNFGAFCLALSADNRRALVGCIGQVMKDGNKGSTILLLDLDKERILARFLGHRNMVVSVAFSVDGRYAFSSSNKGPIRVWDLKKFLPTEKKSAKRPLPQRDPNQ